MGRYDIALLLHGCTATHEVSVGATMMMTYATACRGAWVAQVADRASVRRGTGPNLAITSFFSCRKRTCRIWIV